MAGMFYSLQEAAEKLRVSEDEVKQLTKQRKLREFRDGENVMFKIDEVDALAEKSASLPIDVTDEAPPPEADDLDLNLAEDEAPAVESDDLDLSLTEEDAAAPIEEADQADTDEDLSLDEPMSLASEEDVAETPEEDLDALLSLDESETSETSAEPALDDLELDDFGAEASADVVLEADTMDMTADDEPQIDLSDTTEASDADSLKEVPELTNGTEAEIDDVLLASDDATSVLSYDELGEDTVVTEEGINVLGETDGDYQLTDDTMAETLAGLGATGEASLEEIEDDVNLDSFGGSGSGLLDLSLQADDTSLGGILDEIYTNEDENAPAPDTEQATAEAMTAEVDELSVSDEAEPEDEDAASMALAATPVVAASAEAAPDASSNIFGTLLLLPLILLIYTAIVAWSASVSGRLPGIAIAIKGLTWMVMGGLLVVALVWAAIGATKGGAAGGKTKTKKAKKPKKEKKAKAKKEKKPKEKKAKKPLFGKKK
jgi:excisionase family DNA binding protein